MRIKPVTLFYTLDVSFRYMVQDVKYMCSPL